MRLIVTRPLFWLLAQGVALLVVCCTSDAFAFFAHDMDQYWVTLREMESATLPEILINVRTFGYPLFIKLVEQVSPTLEWLPFFHLLLRVLAVCVFYGGLRAVGLGGWLALVAASPLFYTNAVFSHDPQIRITYLMTDAQGESLTVMTAGFLLTLVARPTAWTGWVGFTLCLFFAYQTRPAYQSFVMLLPILGILLFGMVASREDWVRRRLRVGMGLLAAGMVPYLAWCTMRLMVVGHFGLVCFTGYQMCALAGNFVSDDILPDLPEDVRDYVRIALARRDLIIRGDEPALFGEWRPSFDEQGRLKPGIIDDDILYTFIQHDMFYCAAEEMGWGAVERDKQQAKAALAIIRARPGFFAQWIVATLKSMPYKLIGSNKVLTFLTTLLGLGLVFWHVAYVLRRIFGGGQTVPRSGNALAYVWELNLLLVLGLGVTVSQTLLLAVLATTSYGGRYADSPTIFLPAAVSVALVLVLHRGGELLRRPKTQGTESASAEREVSPAA